MKELLSFFLLTSTVLSAQSFEGKITYQNTYTSKIQDVTNDQFRGMMGSVQDYFIKGAKYKSVTNGSYAQMQLYIPSENRLYSKLSVTDTLMWSDGNSNLDEAVSYEIQKSQVEILGYKCDALVVVTKMGKATYYFSEKVKVDPELYKNHHYGNWGLIISQTKSLPLKIEMETLQFTMVSTAVEMKEMELENSFFDLPNAPIKKSPY